MFYPLQIIKNKETGELGTFIKVVAKKNEDPWLIKVIIENRSGSISNINKWEEATLPNRKA